MPQLLQGAGDSYSARIEPTRYFFSEPLKPGDEGDLISKGGEGLVNAAQNFATMQEQQESRNVAVKVAQLQEAAGNQIDAAVQSGDPNALDKVQSSIQDQADALQSNIQTKAGLAYAQQHGANLMSDVNSSIFQARSKMAGTQAKQDLLTASNSLAAVVTRDPTKLQSAEAQLDSLGATYKNAPPDVVKSAIAEQKGALEIATARALILQNPTQAGSILKNGAFGNLTAEQRSGLIDESQRQLQANTVAQESAIRLKLMQQEQTSQSTMASLFPKLSDPATIASIPSLVASGQLTPTAGENLTDYAHRVATEGPAAVKSDPATFTSYQQRLSLPYGAPGALDADSLKASMQADLTTGKISLPDALRLQDLADKVQTGDPNYRRVLSMTNLALRQFQSFDPLNAPADAQKFSVDAIAALKKTEAAGTSPETTIFNEKSPEFLLSPSRLAAYHNGGVANLAAQAAGISAANGMQNPNAPARVTISNQADYDALKPGTPYIFNGQYGTKGVAAYQVGQVVNFAQGQYRFKGGDPAKQENWEPAK